MKVIETDYVTLRRAPTSSAKIEPNEKEQLTYADIEFEKRYLDMRIKNRNQQEGQPEVLLGPAQKRGLN